eukprot:gene13236-17740_t
MSSTYGYSTLSSPSNPDNADDVININQPLLIKREFEPDDEKNDIESNASNSANNIPISVFPPISRSLTFPYDKYNSDLIDNTRSNSNDTMNKARKNADRFRHVLTNNRRADNESNKFDNKNHNNNDDDDSMLSLRSLSISSIIRKISGNSNLVDSMSYRNSGDDLPQSPSRSNQHSLLLPPDFFCVVCLENHSILSGISFFNCPQNKLFCRPCIIAYIQHQIHDGITQIACPCLNNEACQAKLTEEEIKSLVDFDFFSKYQRFIHSKNNPNYRECSKCNGSMKKLSSKSSSYAMVCEDVNCGHQSCFIHGDAHPNESCHQYNRRVRYDENATKRLMRKVARKCPNCKIQTEKDGGCNHMTCRVCGNDWCWLCGRSLADYSDHYDPLNIRGCPGGQYMPAPDFALWSYLGEFYYTIQNSCCLQFMYNIPKLLEYGVYMLIACLIGLLSGVVGIVLIIAFFPLTLPLFILFKCFPNLWCPRNSEPLMTIMAPGIAVTGLIGGLILLVVELLWLPFAIVAIILFPCCVCSVFAINQLDGLAVFMSRPVLAVCVLIDGVMHR